MVLRILCSVWRSGAEWNINFPCCCASITNRSSDALRRETLTTQTKGTVAICFLGLSNIDNVRRFGSSPYTRFKKNVVITCITSSPTYSDPSNSPRNHYPRSIGLKYPPITTLPNVDTARLPFGSMCYPHSSSMYATESTVPSRVPTITRRPNRRYDVGWRGYQGFIKS